jgi:HK97 gp10 family phage protein
LIEVQIDTQGIIQMQNKLKHLDQAVARLVDDALTLEIAEIQTATKRLAPKRTGNLASSVFSEKTNEWAFRLGARADYAVFVEFGTRFMQARRFITRALESAVPRLIQHVNTSIDEAIREAAKS